MPSQTKKLTGVFVALLMLPACVPAADDGVGTGGRKGGGTGGASVGTGGTTEGTGGSTPDGSGGSSVGSGGSPGTGGSVGTGGSGTGGAPDGTGGSGSGGRSGSGGAGTGGGQGGGGRGGATGGRGGAAGGLGGGGTTGSGGSMGGTGGMPVKVDLATSIPSQYGTAVANPGKVTAKTYPVYYYTTQSAGPATLALTTIPKQSTPIMKPVNVYTPPGYDPTIQYPVIFVFHGITDNETSWIMRANKPLIINVLDNLITSKVIKPIIAVFPHGNSRPSYRADEKDTSYQIVAGYHVFGSELMNDLVPFIEANFSVKKDRWSRAIAGFSMGGMQTINTGLCANLKNFAWFGALHPMGGNFNSTDVAKYIDMQDPKTNPIGFFYAGAGTGDSSAASSAKNSTDGLATKTTAITSANLAVQTNYPGAHNYTTAEIALYNFIRIAFAN